jgi:hypothetical protein
VLAIAPAQASLTVAPSGSVSDTLTLTAASGYTGTLQLSCTGLPQDATCSFQPSSVTFTGTGNSTNVMLSVQTGISARAIVPHFFPSSNRNLTALAGIFWLPVLLLCGFAPRTRRLHLHGRLLLALLVGGLCTFVTACGSSPASPPQTPAGTSTFQVVAAGPSGISQTTSLTLTVR